jgi:hypothetical protein
MLFAFSARETLAVAKEGLNVTNFLVLALVGLIPQFAVADHVRVHAGVYAPNPDLPEHNENFFSPNVYSHRVWTPDLQLIQDEIERHLVLPQSLVRSFIMVGEKRISARARPLRLTVKRVQRGPEAAKKFVRASLASGAYFLPRGQHPTVQLLIGDAGASGVSDLVRLYAEARGRHILGFSFFGRPDLKTVAQKIQDELDVNPSPIILIENLEHLSPEALQALEALIKYPALARNATIILTTESHSLLPPFHEGSEVLANYGVEFLKDLKPYIDVIHVVRRPQSPNYYRRILEIKVKELLTRLAFLHKLVSPPVLADEDRILNDLARGLFEAQERMGHSLLRTTEFLLAQADVNNCEDFLSPRPDVNNENLVKAIEAYGKALSEAKAAAGITPP